MEYSKPTAADERRLDIDWLRIAATYLLFVFHVAMPFSPAPFFHVRNPQSSTVALIATAFIHLWHMPLFFVLAGWSMLASIQRRGTAAFFVERVFKLLIPLIVGCALFGPIIKYIELSGGQDLSHTGLRVAAELQAGFRSVIPTGLAVAPPFHERFAEFWPTYFTSFGRFTWSHLWFVAYLLTFTVVLHPMYRSLAKLRLQSERCPAGWVYAPLVPLVLVQVFLRPHWPGVQNLYADWANVAYYATFLTLGFLLARFPAFEAAVHGERNRAATLAVLVLSLLVTAVAGVPIPESCILAGTAIAGWCCIIVILGLGHQFLRRPLRGLDYLRESAFPVYVLHQPAIVLLGALVVAQPGGIGKKYLVLLAGSVALTMTVYHMLVRRSPTLRVLFGMKPPSRSHRHGRLLVGRAEMVGILLTLSALLVTAGTIEGRAQAAAAEGLWWAEGGAAQIAVEPCGSALCGTVVWLRSPFDVDGCRLRDDNNPDETERVRSVLGLRILSGLQATADGAATWTGGRIYDPGSGRTYRCTAELVSDDRLRLRGYVGIPLLGRDVTWIRVGTEQSGCALMPASASR